jgi:hypothetical protein
MIKNETHKPPRFRQVSSGAYLLQMWEEFLRNKIAFEQEKTCPKAIFVSTLISYLTAFF